MAISRLTKYLRQDRMPHVWCPGCGNGVIMKAFVDAVDRESLDPDRIAVVSGIGCSSRVTGYLNFNTMHTLHGRAVAFATGVKLARPEFNVIVMGGDGDMMAIGGNHFIHACRRNMDITTIVFNNNIYGMTGGQYSPTTPTEKIASTSPYGNVENSFDIVKVAMAAGATYVARSTVIHYAQAVQFIRNGLKHKGMAVIEIMTNCHTYYGRYNSLSKPQDMLNYFKTNTIQLAKAKTMSPEEIGDKIVAGEFVNVDTETYIDRYEKMREKVLAAEGGERE